MRSSRLVIFVTGSFHCTYVIVGRSVPKNGKKEKSEDIFRKGEGGNIVL